MRAEGGNACSPAGKDGSRFSQGRRHGNRRILDFLMVAGQGAAGMAVSGRSAEETACGGPQRPRP
jgi:hypothetical protein